jgi:hypothetical protein
MNKTYPLCNLKNNFYIDRRHNVLKFMAQELHMVATHTPHSTCMADLYFNSNKKFATVSLVLEIPSENMVNLPRNRKGHDFFPMHGLLPIMQMQELWNRFSFPALHHHSWQKG